MNLSGVNILYEKIKTEVRKVILEQDKMIENALLALLCGGHVLIEGVPGLGKTLFVKALADSMQISCNRIQFTPDMMPADVVGTKVFNMQNQQFELRQGPVFANLILADEINRTPPKTQAGLLEAMQEASVSIDGETMFLPQPFLVLATQNPIEYEGTYALPEALVDRFLFKIKIEYPSKEAESDILRRLNQMQTQKLDTKICGVEAVCSASEILEAREAIGKVRVEDSLFQYMIDIIQATRKHKAIEIGSSPRGGIALLNASKAYAAMHGRDFVIPEDIKEVAMPALNHRIVLIPEAELEGIKVEQVLSGILNEVKVPR